MNRRPAIMAAAVLVALVGCAGPVSIADGEYPGLPVGVPPDVGDAASGEPLAYWTGAELHVAVASSSECPLLPTGLDLDGAEVEITVQRSGGDACSDDLAYRTHVFRLDDEPRTVVLDHAGSRREIEVVRLD